MVHFDQLLAHFYHLNQRTYKILSKAAISVTESLFYDLPETDVYIDNVGVFSDTWTEQLHSLTHVLIILQQANFMASPLKYQRGIKETDLTGLKPRHKKIDTNLDLQPHQKFRCTSSFFGTMIFYHDIFPKQSHICAPLIR